MEIPLEISNWLLKNRFISPSEIRLTNSKNSYSANENLTKDFLIGLKFPSILCYLQNQLVFSLIFNFEGK